MDNDLVTGLIVMIVIFAHIFGIASIIDFSDNVEKPIYYVWNSQSFEIFSNFKGTLIGSCIRVGLLFTLTFTLFFICCIFVAYLALLSYCAINCLQKKPNCGSVKEKLN